MTDSLPPGADADVALAALARADVQWGVDSEVFASQPAGQQSEIALADTGRSVVVLTHQGLHFGQG